MAYSYIGGASDGGYSSTLVSSYPLAVTLTVGEYVVVCFSCELNPGTLTLDDNLGNTYTAVGTLDTSASFGCQVFVCQAVTTGGSATITAHMTTAVRYSILSADRYTGLTGVPQSAIVYQTAATSTDGAASPLITPSAQPAMLFGIAFDGYNRSYLAGTGFTLRQAISASYSLRTEDRRLTATTAVTATFTSATANNVKVEGLVIQESSVVPKPGGWKRLFGLMGGLAGLQAPVVVSAPTISGSPTVGFAVIFTAGIMRGNPTPGRSSYQHKVNGANVGTVDTPYTPVAGDVGGTLTIVETWINSQGQTTNTSSGVTVAAAAGGTWAAQDTAFATFTGGYTVDGTGVPVFASADRPGGANISSAKYVYCDPVNGSDAYDGTAGQRVGTTSVGPKQTVNAAWALLTNGAGDWLMLANTASYRDGFSSVGNRSGLSAAHPTVVTTYTPATWATHVGDRTGIITLGWDGTIGPSSELLDSAIGLSRNVLMENIYFNNYGNYRTDTFAGYNSYGTGMLTPNDGLDRNFLFYNCRWRGCSMALQADYQNNITAFFQGTFTNGSTNISSGTTVTSVSGGSYSAPRVGQVCNGEGPSNGFGANNIITALTVATITLSAPATASNAGVTITLSGQNAKGQVVPGVYTGTLTSGSSVVTITGRTSGDVDLYCAIAGTGIPAGAYVTAVTYSSITLTNAYTGTTGTRNGCTDLPRYYAPYVYFRNCSFGYAMRPGGSHAIGLYTWATQNMVIEDCVFHHNGWIGANRDSFFKVQMSANATTSGSFTFSTSWVGASYTGTVTGTITSGSNVIANCVWASGQPINDSPGGLTNITGTGIPGGTTLTIEPGANADIYKHNIYLGTMNTGTIVRRNVSCQGSSHSLQQRGGGICTDNVFLSNPITSLGGGDHYSFATPDGVPYKFSRNIICGSSPISSSGGARGFGWNMINGQSGALTFSGGRLVSGGEAFNNIVCNLGPFVSSPYNIYPVYADASFNQPTVLNWHDNYQYAWGDTSSNGGGASGGVTLQQYLKSAGEPYPAQITGSRVNNVWDQEALGAAAFGPDAYSGAFTGSGNTAASGASWPAPTRSGTTYAISLGYASESDMMDAALSTPLAPWAKNIGDYIRAGFNQ